MYYPPPGASHAATKGLEAAATTFTLNELGEKGAVVAGERVGDVEVEETGAEAAAEVVFQEARDGARREYGGCPSHREAGGSR